MTDKKYEINVTAAPYSDGSGYAAEATIVPGDDGQPSVQINVVYRINAGEWTELRAAIDHALEMAAKI